MLARHMKCCSGCLGASLRGRSDERSITNDQRRMTKVPVAPDWSFSFVVRQMAVAAAVAGADILERFSHVYNSASSQSLLPFWFVDYDRSVAGAWPTWRKTDRRYRRC